MTRDAGSVINGPRTQPGLETRLAKNMYILRLCGMRMNTYYTTLRLIKIQFGSWFEKHIFIPSNEFFKLVRSVLLGGNSNSLIYSSPARIGKKLIKNIY